MQRPVRILMLLALVGLACVMSPAPTVNAPVVDATIVAEMEDLLAQAPEGASQPSEPSKWALWQNGVRLRGAVMHPCKVFASGECQVRVTFQDVLDLRRLGANVIHASFPGVFGVEFPYELNAAALADVDTLLQWAEEAGIFVILAFRSGPGRNEAAIHMDRGANFDLWRDEEAQQAWIEMWRFTAERYQDSPVTIGYNLLVEPHPNMLLDPGGARGPEEIQAELAGSLMDWNLLAKAITGAIREIDSDTPVVVNSLNWGDASWFSILEPTGDGKTVYSPHVYDPDVYTHQEPAAIEISYPDVVYDAGERIEFDQVWLYEQMIPVAEFAETHNVPIFVGEFGVMRWVPGGDQYLLDLTELFEALGWGYSYYVWRGDEDGFDGFNIEYGQSPDQHNPAPDGQLLQLFQNRWQQNIDAPQPRPPS